MKSTLLKMHILGSFVCLIFIDFASSAAVESEKCLKTHIDCYYPKTKSVAAIRFAVDKFQPNKTLQLIQNVKARNPKFQCIVGGCDEELKENLENSLQHFPSEKSNIDGKNPYSLYDDESVTIPSEDDGIYLEWLNSNLISIKETDRDGFPSAEEGFSGENHPTAGDSWTNDDDDHIKNDFDVSKGDWDLFRNGNHYNIEDLGNNSSVPITVFLKPGFRLNKPIRPKREEKKCALGDLKGSTVKCEKWPNLVICKQKCSFGYGLITDVGTKIGMDYRCRFSENVWKPQQFQDCKPYINCKANLKEDEEGYLKCTQKNHRSPPTCFIKCGEKDAGKDYKCSENFIEDLPKCVELEEMELIYPPE